MVLGDFIYDSGKAMQEVLQSFAKECLFPVIGGMPLGHGRRRTPFAVWNSRYITR